MEKPPRIRLVAGLGNPGREYAGTRHNVGFLVLDRLAARLRANFAREGKWKAEVARAGGLVLVKPQTYMNLSGEAVGAVARFYQIKPGECLAVYDDKDLPFGQLRLRESGSAGGHNGVKSLIAHLGTQDFPRLRFGIGAARGGGGGLVSHVLGDFSADERAGLEKELDRAVEAIDYALLSGFPQAMNRYNRVDAAPATPKKAPAPPDGSTTTPRPPTTL